MRWSLEESCRWTFWRNGLASTWWEGKVRFTINYCKKKKRFSTWSQTIQEQQSLWRVQPQCCYLKSDGCKDFWSSCPTANLNLILKAHTRSLISTKSLLTPFWGEGRLDVCEAIWDTVWMGKIPPYPSMGKNAPYRSASIPTSSLLYQSFGGVTPWRDTEMMCLLKNKTNREMKP